jgi:MFS family permease
VAGAPLALFTISDGFLYLAIQRHLDFDERFLPLLFTGSAIAYMVLAVPVGRLADRLGRRRIFISGYAVLLPVYASLLVPAVGLAMLPVYFVLIGCYYAATDGVLMALASSLLPERLRGTGLALLVTATSLSRLLASIALGAIWTWIGLETAVLSFGIGLLLAMSLAGVVLARVREDTSHG